MSNESVEGYACCVLGSLFTAAGFLAFKKVKAGDGVFFCFCRSLGSLLVGLIVDFTLANGYFKHFSFHTPPKFEAGVMWSGAAWFLGIVMCPVLVERVGVGVAVGIWGTMDLLTAWAAARLGLFGLQKEPVASPLLNYIGVALACMSMIAFMLVEQGMPKADATGVVNDDAAGLQMDGKVQQDHNDEVGGINDVRFGPTITTSTTATTASSSPAHDVAAKITPEVPMQVTLKRDVELAAGAGATSPKQVSGVPQVLCRCRHNTKVGGVLGAMLSGFLQGLEMDGTQHMVEQGEKGWDHSTYWADYVCPLYTGIFAMAATLLAVYVIKNGRGSYCPRSVVLPGILTGILGALSTLCMFQAGDKLGMVISYPLMATIIAILTTVMAFSCGEFKTRYSCGLAVVGTLVRIIAVLLIAFSSTVDDMEQAAGT